MVLLDTDKHLHNGHNKKMAKQKAKAKKKTLTKKQRVANKKRKETLIVKNISAAIKKYDGNLATVAKALRKSRQTIYNYTKKYPKLKDLITDTRETMLDNVENKLYETAKEGNVTAMIFFLKTQGKKRGYVERQEFANPEGEELVIRIIRE